MRIFCFTDNMGSGGAQRQLSFLAILLAKRGHDVTVITYNQGSFFDQLLKDNNIKRVKIKCSYKYQIPLRLSRIFRDEIPDGVIAFQAIASLYAEIASIYRKKWTLVVSERNLKPQNKLFHDLARSLHCISDAVVTNSHTTRFFLASRYFYLNKKLYTIYNGVDLTEFKPTSFCFHRTLFRFVVLASHSYQKNFKTLAKAVKLLENQNNIPRFRLDWFGDESPGWLQRDVEIARDLGLKSVFFHSPTHCISRELNNAHALILPSFYEGLPNVVCESLSCGCPVLMSNVCDAKYLVTEGETGYLFDPHDPFSIADAIIKFMCLPELDHMAFRNSARSSAEILFNPDAFCLGFENFICQSSD